MNGPVFIGSFFGITDWRYSMMPVKFNGLISNVG